MYLLVLCIFAINPARGFPSTPTLLNSFSNLNEISSNKINQIISSKAINIVPPFPNAGRQRAVLEQESILSKIDSGYSNLQEFAANLFHPQPLVDTIQEHEKYGNDGGKIRAASVAVVGGVESFSNVLNTAVDVPFTVKTALNKKLSQALGPVGAKLAG